MFRGSVSLDTSVPFSPESSEFFENTVLLLEMDKGSEKTEISTEIHAPCLLRQ